MKVGFLRVAENTRAYGNTYVMWFEAAPVTSPPGPLSDFGEGETSGAGSGPYRAASPSQRQSQADFLSGAGPGQFLMLRTADFVAGADVAPSAESLADDPLLPRAMSYHRLRETGAGRQFSILYDVVGRGTAWLARRQAGDLVYGWGPLGRGYSLRNAGQNLLLVGGGIGIAPLLWLADEAVARGHGVVLLDGARDAAGVFPADRVPSEVEVVVTTQDGSVGRRGLVTDVFLDYFEWADTVYVCGPNPMFAALADVIRSKEGPGRIRRRKPVQALLESQMGCGTGICYGCAVFDRRGDARLVCKEGPRFELRDIW
jgi:dihydroorotate dehydrogenase electron transfer subunit